MRAVRCMFHQHARVVINIPCFSPAIFDRLPPKLAYGVGPRVGQSAGSRSAIHGASSYLCAIRSFENAPAQFSTRSTRSFGVLSPQHWYATSWFEHERGRRAGPLYNVVKIACCSSQTSPSPDVPCTVRRSRRWPEDEHAQGPGARSQGSWARTRAVVTTGCEPQFGLGPIAHSRSAGLGPSVDDALPRYHACAGGEFTAMTFPGRE